ncbi:MAG: hypothetical protein NC318_14045, partial [Blautia sp.]|nr:hypothetical protein [Blautia sp.]
MKDSGAVLQSDEETQSPNEMIEELNGQETDDTLPPFFVDIEDEYPKGVQINDQTFDVNLNPFG